MIDQLEEFYTKNGISSVHFVCKHRDDCENLDRGNFTGPKAALVGRHYGSGRVPKLLFVSLDSGSGETNPDLRTLQEVRKWQEEECVVDKLEKHKHWYRTLELAASILSTFDNSITIENSHQYLAHTNSAKCCVNSAGRAMAPWKLFNNCREYLKGEIEILNPDILISQGKPARVGIMNSFESHIHGDQNHCGHAIIEFEGRKIPWLHTYHPRYFGGFNRQRRDCYKVWGALASDLLNRAI
jgi:hypothetical protein